MAEELGERFPAERRARHEVFPDVELALQELKAGYILGVVTNGASCLQREKLHASGLGDLFQIVVVSADLGLAKPDPSVFRKAASGFPPQSAVMVGDSLEKDVEGARSAGLRAVWLNRSRRARTDDSDVTEMAALTELSRVLQTLW